MGELKRLRVIGAGPGAADYLLPVAREKANECDMLFGSGRALELFPAAAHQTRMAFREPLANYLPLLMENPERQKGVVVAGDPGFYSLLHFLRGHFPAETLEVIPGLSSVQYLFAKIATPWQDYHLTSFHGREMASLPELLDRYGRVALLTDARNSPESVCRALSGTVYEAYQIIVGENLSYPDERIRTGRVCEMAQERQMYQMAVVIIHEQR